MTDALPINSGAMRTDVSPTRIYLDFYRLAEAPFSITPDPEFLFSSGCHQQVLDKIAYAIEARMGFVLLTGEVGTGKTTLCRTLLDRLSENAETAYVINPSVSGHELLAGILEDMGEAAGPDASKKELIDRLNRRLLDSHGQRPLVVIIDDAQTMAPETLEDLRLMSNLETDKHKLIQVVLSAQPEILNSLADQRLRQLKQRIAIHCRLEPLSASETGGYISRRLFVAGNQGQVSFSQAAKRLIHKASGGIPRLINKICDFSLTAGYVKDAPAISKAHVKQALAELGDLDVAASPKGINALRGAWPAALLVLLAALFFALRPTIRSPEASSHPGRVGTIVHDTVIMASAPQDSTPVDTASTSASDGPSKSSPPPMDRQTDTILAEVTTTAENPQKSDPKRPQRTSAIATPYALQLATYHSLVHAKRGKSYFKNKGVPAHWQMLDDGRWYRLVVGAFEDFDQADRYRRDHGLEVAVVIKSPWTVKVMTGLPDMSATQIRDRLSAIGFDSRTQPGLAGEGEIYTGLFRYLENASVAAQQINDRHPLLAQVVAR